MKRALVLVLIVMLLSTTLLAAQKTQTKLLRLIFINKSGNEILMKLEGEQLGNFYYLTCAAGTKARPEVCVYTVWPDVYNQTTWYGAGELAVCEGKSMSGILIMDANNRLTFPPCDQYNMRTICAAGSDGDYVRFPNSDPRTGLWHPFGPGNLAKGTDKNGETGCMSKGETPTTYSSFPYEVCKIQGETKICRISNTRTHYPEIHDEVGLKRVLNNGEPRQEKVVFFTWQNNFWQVGPAGRSNDDWWPYNRWQVAPGQYIYFYTRVRTRYQPFRWVVRENGIGRYGLIFWRYKYGFTLPW